MLGDCAAALPQTGRDALARLQILASQALEQVRAVSHSLHPPDWQGLTTGEALHYLIQSSGVTSRLEVEIDIRPLPVEPSHTTKIALYRCAQECLSNVRAIRAPPVSRCLWYQPAQWSSSIWKITAADSPENSSPSGKGIGLLAIREHTSALGGICDISSGANGVSISRTAAASRGID